MKAQAPQIYINQRADSSVRAVEFATHGNDHYCFLRVSAANTAQHLDGFLHQAGQEVVSRHADGDTTLLVTRGSQSAAQVLALLQQQGEVMAPLAAAKQFNPWKWRAATSVAGQSLQIASSYKSTGHHSDRRAMFSFAALNMVANLINWTFGAQEKKDPNQLRYLKGQFNQQLAPIVGDAALPGVDEERRKLRPAEDTHQNAGQKAYGFLQKYSVTGGEIGLRVIGSASLAFPHGISGIKQVLKGGTLKEAFHTARNPTTSTFRVGLMMLTGKFVSLLASEPDPYNPKPAGIIRQFREKIAFPLSSVIEGSAATYMGYDKLKHGKIMLGGKEMPDYLNAAGNASFVGGYAIRFHAPYGTLQVDIPELVAHISDGLSKAPREKLPQLLGETSLALSQHFHDDTYSYGTVYGMLARDLRAHHGINVVTAQPDAAKENASIPKTQVHSAAPVTQRLSASAPEAAHAHI